MAHATGTSLQKEGDPRTDLARHKAELITELAEVIANQFNNIMMAVTSYTDLELKKASSVEKRALEHIASNAGRATTSIQLLLGLSRKHNRSPREVSVNELLTSTRNLVQDLVGDRIEVALDLDSSLLNIKADPIELEQLLFSFAMTSKSAMADGGKITLATKLVDLDEGFGGFIENAAPGKYVVFSVSEHKRKGNAQSSADHDQRLDLALRAARAVVRELGGLIRITNDPREGATVEIYLPGLDRAVAHSETSADAVPRTTAGTVLIVEDDDAVRIPAAE